MSVFGRVAPTIAFLLLAPLSTTSALAQSTAERDCPSSCITEYSLPSASDGPFGIAAGPDGAIWFSHGAAIGKMTLGGHTTDYTVPTSGPLIGWVHAGPDGAMWFAERNGGKIGRVTVDGRITEYSLSASAGCFASPSSLPQGITTGSDGALWVTEQCGNKIARLTVDGQLSEYPLPVPKAQPVGITLGPDGALWFIERADRVGRITTGGKISEFPLPKGSFPQRIVAGPDGALWFTENRASKIGRLTPDGAYTAYAAPAGPIGITVGPDGAIWFVANLANEIVRMDATGQVTNEYPIPTPKTGSVGPAFQITVGPDAALWFSENSVNKLGRLQLPTPSARGLVMGSASGSSASFSASFYSSQPGQGYVNFGPGRGCGGLVEVSTGDLRPGTTSHTVLVTGNDLPGTVGDIGIQAGLTYSYEVVTVTNAGVEIDDNAGKCFTVTIPRT